MKYHTGSTELTNFQYFDVLKIISFAKFIGIMSNYVYID